MPTHFISVSDASTMINRCKAQKENILDAHQKGLGIVPLCETFERSAFEAILSDTNCTGVRIYAAMDSNLKIRFVITGINASKVDIFLSDTSGHTPIPSVIENGTRCPDTCPPDSQINS
jgi:hypothetical protein